MQNKTTNFETIYQKKKNLIKKKFKEVGDLFKR